MSENHPNPTSQEILFDLLERLEKSKIECVEYGVEENNPNGVLSYLRIRRVQTPAGLQWGCRRLSFGIEGSGFYTFAFTDILTHASEAVEYFHRPTPFREAMKASRARKGFVEIDANTYTWFASSGQPGKYHEAALERTFPIPSDQKSFDLK